MNDERSTAELEHELVAGLFGDCPASMPEAVSRIMRLAIRHELDPALLWELAKRHWRLPTIGAWAVTQRYPYW